MSPSATKTCYGCRGGGPWPERFWSQVEVDYRGCWIWHGIIDRDGYGRQHEPNIPGTTPAHRVAWGLLVGEPPSDLTADHLCRVRLCVNPDHIQFIPSVENVMRGYGFVAMNARKTHCPRGHPYSGTNLVLTPSNPGGRTARRCRICYVEARRRADASKNRRRRERRVAA